MTTYTVGTPTLVLRASKGSPLLNSEVDANFTNLSNGLQTALLASTYTAADVLAKLNTVTGYGAFNALSPITSVGDLILGNGVNSATRLAIGLNGQVLTSNGTTASWQAVSAGTSALGTGIVKTTTGTGALTVAVAADFPTLNQNTTGSAGSVVNALTIGTGLSGTSYNGSAAVTIANTGVLSFSAGTTGLTPNTATSGAITLGGTLVVGNGGTGVATLTGLAYGNGTSAFTAATATQVVSVIGTTAVTNATNATNTGITAVTTGTTNYLTFVTATSGNLPQLVNSSITANAVNGTITGGIAGGAF